MPDSRVLVIDDSATIRAMIEELLVGRARCPHVALAPDARTAWQLMVQFMPTIITLDLAMPEVDGMVLLDELRGYPHAPIVVVSSATTAGSSIARDAIKRGAEACFDKSRIMSESAEFIRVLKKASIRKPKRAAT